jgi:beta-xylosidase
LGEKFELFRNDPNTWEGGLVEGPALMRRGDYFYMFYAGDACCGRGCTYGVGVARAKSLRGPWQKYSGNPIIKQSQQWKCPGHGSVVSDPQGRDYFLYHAYNSNSFVYPGRQGLLDRITWGPDGWPNFNNSTPSTTAAAPHNQDAPDVLDVQDEFTANRLASTWQWSVTEMPAYTLQSGNNGRLLLQAAPLNIGSMLGQRTKTANYTALTAVDAPSLPKGTLAGLTAIGDPENAVGIGVRDGEIVLWSTKENKTNTLARTPAPRTGPLQLRLTTRQGDKMEFTWSADGQNWKSVDNHPAVDAAYLPPWDRGVRVGLIAKGPATASAAFDWFRISYQAD